MFEWINLDSSITSLLVAGFLGGFLGVRRDIQNHSQNSPHFMGFRTLTFIALLGAVSTTIPTLPILPIVIFIVLAGLVMLAYAHGAFTKNLTGLTTEVSTLLVFWIGVLVGLGQPVIAIVITLILAALNSYRDEIRAFAGTIRRHEWEGALQLLFFSGAILPFLPRETIDPLGVINPFNIWLLVILMSSIGFLGYFMTKYIGAKGGIPLTAFLGATVSSTAVTTSLAEQSKKSDFTNIYATGIMIGNATMLIRMTVVIMLLGSAEVIRLIIPVPLAMALVSAVAAYYFFWRANQDQLKGRKKSKKILQTNIELESPFEIMPAIKFGGVFVVVLLCLALAQRYLGEVGVYMTALLSGFVDVDAIVLSTLESLKVEELAQRVGVTAILIAIVINTMVKVFYVSLLGTRLLTRKVLFGCVATALGGGLAALPLFF